MNWVAPIKDEKTLIYEEKDLTFTYSEKQW